MFGSQENERKAKKMRERKSSEKTLAQNFNTAKKSPYSVLSRAFIANPPFTKHQKKKNKNKYDCNGGKLGRKPKSDKEVKKSKAGNMNSGWKLEQCTGNGKFAGCENSHPTKFCKLRKFFNPAKFHYIPFSSTFYSSFLWFLICNTEFNSDSSCLD